MTLSGRVSGFFKENAVLIVVLAVLALAYVLLQSSPDVATQEELDAVLAGGQPILLDFFSNT